MRPQLPPGLWLFGKHKRLRLRRERKCRRSRKRRRQASLAPLAAGRRCLQHSAGRHRHRRPSHLPQGQARPERRLRAARLVRSQCRAALALAPRKDLHHLACGGQRSMRTMRIPRIHSLLLGRRWTRAQLGRAAGQRAARTRLLRTSHGCSLRCWKERRRRFRPSAIAVPCTRLHSQLQQRCPHTARCVCSGAGTLTSMFGGLMVVASHHSLAHPSHVEGVAAPGGPRQLTDLGGQNLSGIVMLEQLRFMGLVRLAVSPCPCPLLTCCAVIGLGLPVGRQGRTVSVGPDPRSSALFFLAGTATLVPLVLGVQDVVNGAVRPFFDRYSRSKNPSSVVSFGSRIERLFCAGCCSLLTTDESVCCSAQSVCTRGCSCATPSRRCA